ncbi:PREDICTED: ETO1-like protein 2 [Tarenaya hassleriana]|uniref:ETO1-like protein 2 n=1 Tax=Tarenaya hassleriana TaxID=28532 RepID=UPI00053C9728|nr:PREDICTED: ETO1-like protein 2 [Tarenaya hassleriana]XP_010535360.1 PREDICTED: ETO1-like protein 2 [Tarenaya hassleriana]
MRNLKLLEKFKSTQIHALNSQDSSSSGTNGSPRFKFLGHSISKKTTPTPASRVLLPYGFPTTDLLEPPLDSFLKPIDLVETLSNLFRRIESSSESEKSMLYVEQYAALRGLGDAKLSRRCLLNSRQHAIDVPCKVILSAWLRFERREHELVGVKSLDCNGFVLECPSDSLIHGYDMNRVNEHCKCHVAYNEGSGEVLEAEEFEEILSVEEDCDILFSVGPAEVKCVRSRIAALSQPFEAMLYGSFMESRTSRIDFSENSVSVEAVRALNVYSRIQRVDLFRAETVLELLGLATKFCCDDLKSACDARLASSVDNIHKALDFIDYALEERAQLLVSACLQAILRQLPQSLYNPRVTRLFCSLEAKEQLAVLGSNALFLLYYFLSQVGIEENLATGTLLILLERMRDFSGGNWQKALALHQIGCVLLQRKDYKDAQFHFRLASSLGHIYSLAGVARTEYKQGQRYSAYKLMTHLLSNHKRHGWMYQERSLYNVENEKLNDLAAATELDPTLTFPYKYRAVMKFEEKQVKEAIAEIDRIIRFKLTPDCLELRAWLYSASGDHGSCLRDIRALLCLEPNCVVFGGRVRGDEMVEVLTRRHIKQQEEEQSDGDCWVRLYDSWSAVDDIGSLAVVQQMLQSDPKKNFLRFRQSLLLLRLNCQRAALRCLRLARNLAASEAEKFVYEGWMLYDMGHVDAALDKAEKAISIQRSFEAFFLKAYVLADKNLDPVETSSVIHILEEALKCPSDGLRKGQALNNLGSIYIDCGKLDQAEAAYMNALDIKHTRAHQGLARVYFLKNQRKAAYEEMTKLIEKACNKASAYEKRSEYCERDRAKEDLDMATSHDPLRTYPYRYRAAVMMDDQKEREAVEELSKAIAFRPELQTLHLRAAFYEAMGKLSLAAQDCEAALCLDPNHSDTLHLYYRSKTQACLDIQDQ